MTPSRFCYVFATLLALTACEGSSGRPPAHDVGTDGGSSLDSGELGAVEGGASPDGAGAPHAASRIGASGGTVNGPDGASVEIPAGALTSEVEIGIAESGDGAPPLPPGFVPYGALFALTPHGTHFAAPVTVHLPYDARSLPDGGKLALYKTNAARSWEPVDDAQFDAGQVTATVTGFSWFVTGDPGLLRELPIRTYGFRFYTLDGQETPETQNPVVIGGLLHEHFDFGQNDVFDVDHDGTTSLEVFSTPDGRDFWASADAPHGSSTNPKSVVAGETELRQEQSFVKAAADATLSFVVKEAFVEGVDFNGDPSRAECPWGADSLNAVLTDSCDLLRARIAFTVRAYDEHGDLVDPHRVQLLQSGGYADLTGHSGGWFLKTGVYTSAVGLTSGIWDKSDFTFTQDQDGSSGRQHARAALAHPIKLDVDLSSVKVGKEFTIATYMLASAYNRRGRESGIGAYLRDPSKVAGATLETTGLVATNHPLPEPTGAPIAIATCPSGTDPEAGVLELDAASYTVAEEPLAGRAAVDVIRTGGSRGDVSVTFTASGGDAVPGVDYAPITTTIVFPDGDTTPRTVPLEILLDDVAEPDRTVTLTLSNPGGCAALGARSSAVLTIKDDDQTVTPPDQFTVGGTISGLSGTGLVLSTLGVDTSITVDGGFVLSGTHSDGSLYDVRVKNQPTRPDQICVLTNGRGNIHAANVSNLVVTCTTPPIDPALDPTFGLAGVASSAVGGGPSAMVLAPDGKIVMAGGALANFTLARYSSDGALDSAFGSNGTVTTDVGGLDDQAYALALEPDGKILVAGYVETRAGPNLPSNYDFALVRYLSNGSLDTTFGTGGKVTTDFAGSTDRARAVAVTSDGSILVAGDVSGRATSSIVGGVDFGLARYTPDGNLDTTFGTGGKLTVDIGGSGDFAHRLALLPGSAILVTGAIGFPGDSSADHTGLVRLDASGKLDTTFGSGGKVVIRDRELGEGLAVQSDGKLVVVGTVSVMGVSSFAAMRLTPAGATDESFGTAGLVTTSFSTSNDVAHSVVVAKDGKIVVAGQSSNLSNSNFAVARYDSDGKLDATFGVGGKIVHDFYGAFDGADEVALDASGKVVAGGFAGNGTHTGYALLRVAH